MATRVSIISLSIASAYTAVLLIQTAIQGSSIQALGQMVASGLIMTINESDKKRCMSRYSRSDEIEVCKYR
jgi:hypothetical protein